MTFYIEYEGIPFSGDIDPDADKGVFNELDMHIIEDGGKIRYVDMKAIDHILDWQEVEAMWEQALEAAEEDRRQENIIDRAEEEAGNVL